MPNITTPFSGTDGATRANFNLKIADMNTHGNDTTAHVTQEKQDAWNAKANLSDIPSSLPANGGTAADTTNITSALTLSTAAPTATLAAGKLYGVY